MLSAPAPSAPGSQRFPCTSFIVGLHCFNCRLHHSTFCNVRALCECYRRRHFGSSRPSALPPYPPLLPVGTQRFPCTVFNHGLHIIKCNQHQLTFFNGRALCESYLS